MRLLAKISFFAFALPYRESAKKYIDFIKKQERERKKCKLSEKNSDVRTNNRRQAVEPRKPGEKRKVRHKMYEL